MTSGRDAFLGRVRRALDQGNQPGDSSPVPSRDGAGYQGAGPDPVTRFIEELTAAGGNGYLVPDREAAAVQVLELVRAKAARRVLLGRGAFLDALVLPERLRALGLEVTMVDPHAVDDRDPLFAADLGISGVDYLIAETGTVVLAARPEAPRSLSLLPPVHIAVAERCQLLPDLFDLFEPGLWQGTGGPPSCLSLITGPSKTGDIELRLVTGVHGPGEVHVILVTAAEGDSP